jgi:AraC family transcriptional regulator
LGSVTSLSDTHGLVTRPSTRIWASSEGRGWRSIFATAQRELPFSGYFRAVTDHLVVIHLSGPVQVTRKVSGKKERFMVPPGGAFIMPGGTDFGVDLEGELETLHFYLDRKLVDDIGQELGSSGLNRIIPSLGQIDPMLERIAFELRDQLRDPQGTSGLYVDHLARMAGARLVHAHSAGPAKRRPALPRFGLTKRQLRSAIEFIHSKLDQDLALSEIAAAVDLSPTYFARQFRLATGLPPHQFVLQARVEHAKRQLTHSALSLSDIALDCGFCNQEHFSRVFRKYSGTTPGAYRAAAL